MAEQECFAFFEVGCHLGFINRRALEVRGCEKDDIGLLCRLADIQHRKTMFLGNRGRFTSFVQADHHFYPAVFQIEGMRVPL